MLTKDQLDIGQWFTDRINLNYCVIQFISDTILVKRYDNSTYTISLTDLMPIVINDHNISIAGFSNGPDVYQKTLPQTNLYLKRDSPRSYAIYRDKENGFSVEFIHELQTGYELLSGEKLHLNLFGI